MTLVPLQAQMQSQLVRALLRLLANLGVNHVVLSPGSRSTPLAQAVAEREHLGDWPVTVVLDERSAAFVAVGLARAGRLPLVVCTSGSAVANWLPAVVEAGESSLPLIFLSGDRPLQLQNVGAPQTVRQQQFLASYAAVLHLEVCVPEGMGQFATIAAELLQYGAQLRARGLPLHINVGLDLPLALQPGPALPRQPVEITAVIALQGPPVPPPQPGERVVVIAGPLVPQDPQLLKRLTNSALLLAEWPSHLADGQLRYFDLWLRDPGVRQRTLPDRIVRLGEWPASKGLQLLLDDAAAAQVPIQVIEPGRTSDPLKGNQLSTPLPPLQATAGWVDAPLPVPLVQAWRSAFHKIDQRVATQLALLPGPIERQLLGCLATAVQPGAQLVLANSMAIRDADAFCPQIPKDVHVHVARGANGIDGTLATALGLALARGTTWLLLGDGAFLHDIGSLQLLTQQRADVRAIVVDNGGGAIFDLLPAAQVIDPQVHQRLFYAPHGLDLLAIAQGFGLPAQRFGDPAALLAWLAGDNPGPRLGILAVDRDRSLLHRRAMQQQVLASLAKT